MIPVLVESPYAGKSPPDSRLYRLEVEYNLCYLRAAMADCFKRGEAPFASHALYTQEGVLDDTIPVERQLGIDAGLLWGSFAQKTVIYTDLGVSRGMEYGIANAIRSGRLIEHRSLPGWAPTKTSVANDTAAICTSPNGRTDGHMSFVRADDFACAFCGEDE